MDRLDAKLIAHLQKNGNVTNSSLAKEKDIGVSEETVRRRLKKLRDDEYIKVIAIPNASKIGFGLQVMVGLQVDADKAEDVAEALSELNEVTWVSVTTGAYDMFAWATLRSSDDLSDFLLLGVGKIRGVKKMETFFVLKNHKQEYGPNMEALIGT